MRNHARLKRRIKKEWEETHNNLEDNTQYFHKGVFLNDTHIRDVYWMIQVEQDDVISYGDWMIIEWYNEWWLNGNIEW